MTKSPKPLIVIKTRTDIALKLCAGIAAATWDMFSMVKE